MPWRRIRLLERSLTRQTASLGVFGRIAAMFVCWGASILKVFLVFAGLVADGSLECLQYAVDVLAEWSWIMGSTTQLCCSELL